MPLLFAATLFVSAFLLFLVQPLIGKMILPSLGGTPAVWNTCMVFFQAALLAGYFYTHSVSTYLPTRRQVVLQCCLLAVPLLFLPFTLGAWVPETESNPVFSVLWILLLVVGLPFFVVATSAPLLQKWFVATGHPSGKDPYFLYGASNLGSMLALLLYPILIEPSFSLPGQTWLWAAAYGLFIALTLCCAAAVWLARPEPALADVGAVGARSEAVAAGPPPATPAEQAVAVHAGAAPAAPRATAVRVSKGARRKGRGITSTPPPPAEPAPAAGPAPAGEVITSWRRLRWVGLAAAPSSLMLGVTTYLTTDIAAIPFFWTIPLALYLLTFILVFMRWPVEWTGLPHAIVVVIQPLVVIAQAFLMLSWLGLPTWGTFAMHLMIFFTTAMVCHGELAKDRPSPKYLTEFYLWMSVGGVLGGLFNALLAPMLLGDLIVYSVPAVLIAIAVVVSLAMIPQREDRGLAYGLAVFIGASGGFMLGGTLGRMFADPLTVPAEAFGHVLGMLLGAGAGAALNAYVLERIRNQRLKHSLFVFAGGAIVGCGVAYAFNRWLAPQVANRLIEYPLAVVFACLLRPPTHLFHRIFYPKQKPEESTPQDYILDIGYAVCLGLLSFALLRISTAANIWPQPEYILQGKPTMINTLTEYFYNPTGDQAARNRSWANAQWWARVIEAVFVAGIPCIVCLGFSGRPLRFGLGLLALLIVNSPHILDSSTTVHNHRGFFGVLRVKEDALEANPNRPRGVPPELAPCVTLIHGGINHGTQLADPEMRDTPITYFDPTGGVGQIFSNFKEVRGAPPYAIVGLGIGSLAVYSSDKQPQTVHFYEIDPAVRDLSQPPEGQKRHFHYLHDAATRRKTDIKVFMGDGRLKLKEAPDNYYHILVLDAFSSDAIPVHLLTKDALELYMKKTADGGLIIFNITNRYVDMEPVLGDLAADLGLIAIYYGDTAYDRKTGRYVPFKYSSDWVVMAKPIKNPGTLAAEVTHLFGAAPPAPGLAGVPWATLARTAGGPVQAPIPVDDPEEMRRLSFVKQMNPHGWQPGKTVQTPWGPPAAKTQLVVPPLLLRLEYSPPLLHKGEQDAEPMLHYAVEGWRPARRLHERVWTDDYSNLLRVLYW